LEHIKHLNKDKKLKAIISTQETIVLKKEKNIYLWICFSIISQQLSTKVAKVIQQRFLVSETFHSHRTLFLLFLLAIE
jgi:DNA-3-methyladenine glycosylase II